MPVFATLSARSASNHFFADSDPPHSLFADSDTLYRPPHSARPTRKQYTFSAVLPTARTNPFGHSHADSPFSAGPAANPFSEQLSHFPLNPLAAFGTAEPLRHFDPIFDTKEPRGHFDTLFETPEPLDHFDTAPSKLKSSFNTPHSLASTASAHLAGNSRTAPLTPISRLSSPNIAQTAKDPQLVFESLISPPSSPPKLTASEVWGPF